MSAYNVRVYNYVSGQQIRIYNKVYNDIVEIEESISSDIDITDDVNIENISGSEIWNNIEEYEDIIPEFNENKEDVYVRKSLNRTINKLYEITRSNEWEYFITLTFNPEKVDSFNYDIVVLKLTIWLNNLKKRYAPELKYIIVPELHKSGRWHFHGLISNIGNIELVDSGHLDYTGNIIYNLGNYKLGWSTATKIKDMQKVSFYITKYISKELCAVTKNKKRYWSSRNLAKPIIQEFMLSAEEIKGMLCDISESIKYCKTVSNDVLGITTKYIEVDY